MTQYGRGPAARRDSYHHSHRVLLRHIPEGISRTPDAIVVPAARQANQLATAADLAHRLGCLLVALCSRDARAAEVCRFVSTEWPDLRWLALDVPAGYEHELLTFDTSRIEDVKAARLGDLSTKRNLGLLLARIVGWRSLMFLDDDIERVRPEDVRRGAAAIGRVDAAGLIVDNYPDNSVVCHANRLTECHQDVFASGAALIVRGNMNSFFPEIYNEDWLFMFGSLALDRVASAGSADQLSYSPFATPARAEAEEFGDLLAEGLVGLLQDKQPQGRARETEFWETALERRRIFIERIMGDIANNGNWLLRGPALTALKAAEARRGSITAASCAAYVRTWLDDRRAWAQRLADQERKRTLAAALDFLGLHEFAFSSADIP